MLNCFCDASHKCLCVVQVSGPVFFSRTVAEKLLQTHVTSPLDGCTYLGMDSGALPIEVKTYL